MILLGVVPLLVQVTTWETTPAEATVGDTVVIERGILVADPGASVLLSPMEPSSLVEPLSPPEVIRAAEGFVARYTLALFQPGDHALSMPAVGIAYADGRTETLGGGVAFVTVLSVLPEGDSLPPPRGSRDPLIRGVRRILPTALLMTAVIAASTVWGVARRRSRPRPAWPSEDGVDAEPPLQRWIASGEHRAVATVAMSRVRERVAALIPPARHSLHIEEWLEIIAAHQPQWPVGELGDVMRALERASFAPAIPSDVIALADEADVLSQSLELTEVEQV